MKRNFKKLIAVLALTMLSVSCGSKDEGGSAPVNPTPTTTTTEQVNHTKLSSLKKSLEAKSVSAGLKINDEICHSPMQNGCSNSGLTWQGNLTINLFNPDFWAGNTSLFETSSSSGTMAQFKRIIDIDGNVVSYEDQDNVVSIFDNAAKAALISELLNPAQTLNLASYGISVDEKNTKVTQVNIPVSGSNKTIKAYRVDFAFVQQQMNYNQNPFQTNIVANTAPQPIAIQHSVIVSDQIPLLMNPVGIQSQLQPMANTMLQTSSL